MNIVVNKLDQPLPALPAPPTAPPPAPPSVLSSHLHSMYNPRHPGSMRQSENSGSHHSGSNPNNYSLQQNQYEVPHLPVARYGQVYGEQQYPYGRQHLVHY